MQRQGISRKIYGIPYFERNQEGCRKVSKDNSLVRYLPNDVGANFAPEKSTSRAESLRKRCDNDSDRHNSRTSADAEVRNIANVGRRVKKQELEKGATYQDRPSHAAEGV